MFIVHLRSIFPCLCKSNVAGLECIRRGELIVVLFAKGNESTEECMYSTCS